MTLWSGPSGAINPGAYIVSKEVKDSFDGFSDAVNDIHPNNFNLKERFLTARSFHRGALTQTFEETQLVQNEPACFVAIGRTSTTASYSLGAHENVYTVDGCGTRILVDRPCMITVDAFVEFDEIKISNQARRAGSANDSQHGIDLKLVFRIKMGSGSTVTVGSAFIYRPERSLRLEADGGAGTTEYLNTNALRRGFSVHVPYRLHVTDVANGGGYVDVALEMLPEIVAAKLAAVANTATGSISSAYILYAHLRSKSRGITSRVFQTGVGG